MAMASKSLQVVANNIKIRIENQQLHIHRSERETCLPISGRNGLFQSGKELRICWKQNRVRERRRTLSHKIEVKASIDRAPSAEGLQESLSLSPSSREYELLKGIKVQRASDGQVVDLLSTWSARDGSLCMVVFLTHFADLSSWELTQKLVQKVLPVLSTRNVPLVAIGLGSIENATKFAEIHGFPASQLYADPDGDCYRALGFSRGAFPEADVSPYLKLLAMLAGIESPGTLQEVLQGYVGDKDRKQVFDGPSPFDILGQGYQRPFELATLRLSNMVGILPRWGELSPPNANLLTQQGGVIVFNGKMCAYRSDDTGILKYADTEKLLKLFRAE